MAYTTPSTVGGSDVLTAALWNTQIRDNFSFLATLQFTTEAARDAAIPTPIAGQRARLTAPVTNTAVGSNTSIASGITTVYDGTRWICTTPICASYGYGVTNATAAWTRLLAGLLSVTMVTGSRVLIQFGGMATVSSGAGDNTIGVNNAVSLPDNTGLLTTRLTTQSNPSFVQYVRTVTPGTNVFQWFAYQFGGGTQTLATTAITITSLA